jgi:mono/diheme cytochrome c family protein
MTLAMLGGGLLAAVLLVAPPGGETRGTVCVGAREHALPLPTTVAAAQFVDYEKQILGFLQRGEYKALRWCVDKGVRDTGPFIEGVYFGTHPAVRIYYSPTIMRWLLAGRQGTIPDGAMIIKEQYPPPAGRYAGLTEDQLPRVSDWTVMIKDSQGSKDGWFWGEFFDTMTFDDDQIPFQYPWAGFGLYCLRCHATAEREHTFAALNNIKGFRGQPLTFFDDSSWRQSTARAASTHGRRPTQAPQLDASLPDPEFLRIFNAIPGVPLASVQTLPSETYDHIVPPATGPGQFVSSSQCLSCHSGLNGPFGPVMFLPTGPTVNGVTPGANVSPYGEWRWSPMGLAGRDPVFYSQLESEFAYFKTLPPAKAELLSTAVRNTCLRCHGAMGKRQLDTDSGGSGDFRLEFIQLTDRDDRHFKYGALARDGISCAVCHRAVPTETPAGATPLEYFLQTSITGQFQVGPPDRLFGPFPDGELAPYAMQTATGITPRFSPYIQSSRLCGSCHTIDLPVLDGQPGQMSIEQATYLEWLNSQYQTEFGLPGPNARTCQGCHMPSGYHSATKGLDVPRLEQKIAIIEDETYPDAEHRVPIEDITVRVRQEGFRRHEFLGLNVFLLEMFRQFYDLLGVRTPDYMSGSTTGLQDAIDNFAQQAQERTARIAASARATGPRQIEADVAVTNLAGHRLPSGVGFLRAFLEVLVTDADGKVVWASGRTNRLGIIVDGNGEILPSEFFGEYTDGQGNIQQHHQPHHEAITTQDQVQIYEELTKNSDGKFTTNFTRRFEIVKDNRLLPIGWTEHGPDPSLNGRFLEATHPEGSAAHDPDYHDGLGTDRVTYRMTLPAGVDAAKCTVQATLYYQATPPYYLDQRFRAAPDGDATRRLYFLASNLELRGTPAEGWKLPIVSTTTPVK